MAVPQLYVTAALGLADRLVAGPLDADALARATDSHPAALRRLLRALAALGVLQELAPEAATRQDSTGVSPEGAGLSTGAVLPRWAGGTRYALTPLGACLREDAPGSQRAWVLTMCHLGYRIWGELLHSIRTGEPGAAGALGAPWYE